MSEKGWLIIYAMFSALVGKKIITINGKRYLELE